MPRAKPAPRAILRGRVVVAGRRISTRAITAALQRVGIHARRVEPSALDAALAEPRVAAVLGVSRPADALVDRLAKLAASGDRRPVFVALTREPTAAVVRRLYGAGVEGVFSWPRERRDLLYAIMRIRSVLAPGSRPMAANPELARRARRRLAADAVDFGAGIRVGALDDVVVLRGSVDALWKVDAAKRAAQSTHGAGRVVANDLEVDAGEMPDRWVAEAVRRILRGAALVDASTIAVAVEDGEVTLAGTVESRAEMLRLLHLVEHARGVRAIRNLTTVSESAKRADRSTARDIRAAIAAECPSAEVDVSVFDGVAVIAGRTARPDDTSAVERAAMRRQGVRRVVNKVWSNAKR